jgi:hypothetical protein
LYQLKRTAESVQLALTSGSDAKARLELQFATVRSDEVTQLISRPSALGAGLAADASISPVTASLIRTTLTSANGDVLAATQLLTQAALRAHSTAPLKILAEWAPGQRERLGEIADRLPAGALRQLALQSARMVEKAKQRVVQLTQVVRCDCGTTKGSDRYGPVPCKTCGTAGSASRSSTNPAVTAVPVPASTPGSVPAPAGSTAPAPYQPDPPAPVEGSTPSGGVSPGPGSTDSPTQVPPTSSAPAVPSDSSDSSLPSLTPSPSSPTLPDAGSTSTDAPPDPSSAPPPSEPSLSDPSSSVPADPPASDLPPTCVPTAASGLDGC